MAEKFTVFVSSIGVNKLFSQHRPYVLSGAVWSKALNRPFSTQHVVNLPNSIKQKNPSNGVVVRALRTEAKEPQDILPVFEPRGHVGNRLIEDVAASEVL